MKRCASNASVGTGAAFIVICCSFVRLLSIQAVRPSVTKVLVPKVLPGFVNLLMRVMCVHLLQVLLNEWDFANSRNPSEALPMTVGGIGCGQWESPAFLVYLDLETLDKGAGVEAHRDESSSDDED